VPDKNAAPGENQSGGMLSRQRIQQRVDELGPWVHAFEFNGVRYFDSKVRPADVFQKAIIRERRTEEFWQAFPRAVRVLELGALEGADTVDLASRPGVEWVAVEGRAENMRRLAFVLELNGLRNVSLVLADVETMDFAELGQFDAAVCSGILYHVRRPWDLLAALARVTPAVFLWTHYWGDAESAVPYGGYLVKEVPEEFPEPRLRGLAPVSRWLVRDSLFRAARDAGFTVEVLAEGGEGPAREITLLLRR
jgi:SAM-dependent methyltransferase